MVRLAEYSRDCLKELRAQTGIRHDERMQGTLQLFRTQAQLDGTASDIAILERYRCRLRAPQPPGLHLPRAGAGAGGVRPPVGGLLLPGDVELATASSSRSGWPRWPTRRGVAVPLRHADPRARAARASASSGVDDRQRRDDCGADAYLVALGSHSPLLLRPIGIRLPVYPVKGYSITVPIVDAAGAPESTVMDETHKVAVTRLGDRIRVGGTAELAGYTLKLHEARRETLAHVVERPVSRSGGDCAARRILVRPAADDARRHAGDRRRRRSANLYLATGHGTLGWTMAAGTGRVIADVISGRSAGNRPRRLDDRPLSGRGALSAAL